MVDCVLSRKKERKKKGREMRKSREKEKEKPFLRGMARGGNLWRGETPPANLFLVEEGLGGTDTSTSRGVGGGGGGEVPLSNLV